MEQAFSQKEAIHSFHKIPQLMTMYHHGKDSGSKIHALTVALIAKKATQPFCVLLRQLSAAMKKWIYKYMDHPIIF